MNPLSAPAYMMGGLQLISLAYSIYLVFSGSPIFWWRARPISTRPVILQDDWFRYAGGVHIVGFLIGWLTGSIVLYNVVRGLAGIAFLVGLWRALSPRKL
jgi:hypothetical protein